MGTKKIRISAIAAHMISQDVAIACLFETLARVQPAVALATAQAIKESSKKFNESKFVGVQKRIAMLVSLLESQAGKALQ